jgi:hypothetical protein
VDIIDTRDGKGGERGGGGHGEWQRSRMVDCVYGVYVVLDAGEMFTVGQIAGGRGASQDGDYDESLPRWRYLCAEALASKENRRTRRRNVRLRIHCKKKIVFGSENLQ